MAEHIVERWEWCSKHHTEYPASSGCPLCNKRDTRSKMSKCNHKWIPYKIQKVLKGDIDFGDTTYIVIAVKCPECRTVLNLKR